MNEKKKMKGLQKRILSFVLTFVMVFAFMPDEAYALGDPDYITIISNNVSWGTVSGSSSSYQYDGKTITVSASGNSLTITGLGTPIVITATPNSGYAFARWEDASGNEFSNASFSDTTNATETVIKAVFAPAGEEYPIFIYSGESYQQVKESNKDDVLGNGTVSFDPETNTLTLSGAEICTGAENNTTGDAIYCNLPAGETLTIKLIGSNVIGKAPSAFNIASGISSKGGAKFLLKCDEDSSLTIYAGESGIKGSDISLGEEGENFEGELKIYSLKTGIHAGEEPTESSEQTEGEITIYGGDIDIESKENGLFAMDPIKLSDVTLNVTANPDLGRVCYAINAKGGLNITGSAFHIVARLDSDFPYYSRAGAIFCPFVTKPEGTKAFGSTEWDAPEESITREAAFDDFSFKMGDDYAKAVILNICSVEQKPGQAATCTEDGWKDYYQCTNTSCSKIYASSSATGTSYADLAAWKASAEGKIESPGHNWIYTASGAALTATCERDASHTATLTLTASSAVYSGSETYSASFSDTSAWTGAGLTVPTIKYYKATAEGGTEGTEEVTNLTGLAVGNYYAAITAGTGEDAVTAKAAFEVKEAVQIPASELKNEIEGLALILGGDKDVMLNQFSFWLTNGVRPTELKSAAATAFMYSNFLLNNVQRGGTGAEIPRTILDKLVAHKETQINLLDAIKANDNELIAAYTDEFFEVLGDVAFEISTDENKEDVGKDVIIKAESLEAFRQNAIARADASTLVSTHERYSSYMEKFCDLLNLDAHKKSVMMAAFGEWLEDEDADTILNLAVDESWLGKWEFTDEEADEILVMFAKTFYSFTAEASCLIGNVTKAVDGEGDKSIEALKTIVNEVSPLAYKVYDLMDAVDCAYWADTLTLMDECISDEKALLEKVFNDTVDYSDDVQASYAALRNTTHVWTDTTHQTSTGVCLICGYTCPHTGGTATCIAKAKCSVCQAEYGEYAAHNYAYSAEGNVLTAACQTDGCNDTHSLTLTASSANYSGNAVEATMDKTAWEAAGLTAPTIEYEAKTGSALTDGKAVNAGSYTAKITVAGKTATKDFEITKASQEVPATGVGYTINYTDETITAGTDYEVSTSNTSFVAPTDGKVVPGNTYYVRKKGNDNYNPSSWTSITVAARPTAPSGYTAVDPTTVGGANGKITGVTTAMEYSTDNGTSWTAVSGTEITGLSAGKVLLRVKATSSAFASTNVEIALSNPHTHAIDVTKKHVAVPSTCKSKGTKEWYECTDSLCDKKLDKNGNELTSIELDFDSSNHEGTATWTKTATTHKETYNCCGAVKTAENKHISSGAATEESAEVCTVCGYELAEKLPHTHKYATAYSKDATGHWHAATCGHDVKDGFAAHTSSGAATEAKAEVCTVCGYEIAPKLNHNHTYATTYSKDVTGHWYAATCGHDVQGSFAAHSYGDWTVTKLATITEAGEKQRTCSVCGYKEAVATTYDKPVGDTDVDPNAGKIENKTDSSKNGCAANVEITKSEIIEKLELTPEELSRVENGEDIAFYLVVTTEESNNISQSEQKEAEKKLESGEKIGQYLDIDLFKIVGNDKSKVSQTNGKIKIEITIPSDILKVGTDFFIIRVHNGVATRLALTLVSGDTYSFETDQFSTYAIGYKEKSSDSNNDNNSNNNTYNSDNKTEETLPQTGDSNDLRCWFFALIALLAGILVLVGLKRKEKTSK